jgi:hypothetical protein
VSNLLKILHLPSSVGGNAWALSMGEKELGFNSDVLYTDNSWLNYPCDKKILLGKSKTYNTFKLIKEFVSIRNKFDVFHFNFGKSLVDLNQINVRLADLPYYPSRKKLLMTFNGCDARQKYPTMKIKSVAACHNVNCYNGMCNSGRLDRKRREDINKASQYIDHFFALNPDLLRFLPPHKSSFLPYAVINSADEQPALMNEKHFTIVHAPTQREAKGSYEIINTVNSIKKEFPFVELVLVENVKHSDALELYRTADLVIDQIKVGWYGAFAVECMYMGKPVAAYIDNNDLKFIPNDMSQELLTSIVNVTPQNLREKIKTLVLNKNKLKEIAQLGLSYANKWHTPTSVAKLVSQYIQN